MRKACLDGRVLRHTLLSFPPAVTRHVALAHTHTRYRCSRAAYLAARFSVLSAVCCRRRAGAPGRQRIRKACRRRRHRSRFRDPVTIARHFVLSHTRAPSEGVKGNGTDQGNVKGGTRRVSRCRQMRERRVKMGVLSASLAFIVAAGQARRLVAQPT